MLDCRIIFLCFMLHNTVHCMVSADLMHLEQQLTHLAGSMTGKQDGAFRDASTSREEKKVVADAQLSDMAMRTRIIITGRQELESAGGFCLSMCSCHPIEKRADFIIKLVNDIKKTYPDTRQNLVYTSLASGSCLQDYLTIQELFLAGYHNLTINIIDLSYPDLFKLPTTQREKNAQYAKLKERKAQLEAEGAKKSIPKAGLPSKEQELYEHYEHLEKIEIFKAKVEQLFFNAGLTGPLRITFYTNIDRYLAQVKHAEEDKSNVLVMVDPGQKAVISLPEVQQAFRYNANVFVFENKLLFFVPHVGPPQLYCSMKPDVYVHDTKLTCIVAELRKMNQASDFSWHTLDKIKSSCNASYELKNDIRLTFRDLFFLASKPDCVAYQMYTGFPEPSHRIEDIKTLKITREYYAKENEIATVADVAGYRHRIF